MAVNINNYTPFFHDGSIIDISHDRDTIVVSMESAEMDEDDLKRESTQATEVVIKLDVLNRMTELGRPKSYRVAC